jgi:hypothetical protein
MSHRSSNAYRVNSIGNEETVSLRLDFSDEESVFIPSG